VLLVLALGVSHLGSRRDLVRFAAPVVLIGAVYAAVLAWIYGSPIPQSVQSKAGGSRLPFDPERTAEILRQSFAPSTAALVALPFVALGFVRALRSRARPFVAFALLIVVSYVASGAKTWGWYYYIPLIAWALALGMGVETAVHWVLERRPGWSPGQRFAAAPAVLALAAVIGVAGFTHRFPDRVTTRVYEPLRAWSDAHGVAERRASIVASDIGAIGWFGGLILDTEGLVWPEAKGYANQVAAVNRHLPDYVVLVATRERVLDFMASPVFDRYRPVRRFNTVGDLDLAPSRGSLPVWWRQDYLVYERVRSGRAGDGEVLG
jgi:hypothetical protein